MSTPSRPTKSIAAASPSAAAALSSSQRLSQDTVDLSAEDSQMADPAHASTYLGPHANTGAPVYLAGLSAEVSVRMSFPALVGRIVQVRDVQGRDRFGRPETNKLTKYAILPGHNWQQMQIDNVDGSRWLQTSDGVCYWQRRRDSPNVRVTPACLGHPKRILRPDQRIPLPAPASPCKQTRTQPAVSATPHRKTRARSPESAAMESPASRQKVAQEKAAGAGARVQRELFPSSNAHKIAIPTMAPTPKVAKPVIHRKPHRSTPMDIEAESDPEWRESESEEDGSEESEEEDDEESASGSGSDSSSSASDGSSGSDAEEEDEDDDDFADTSPAVWYEVKRVRGTRVRSGTREFLVRWKDYPPDKDTWEPRSSFDGTGEEILAAFEAAHADKYGRTDDDDDDDEAEEAKSGEEESDGGAAAAPPSSGHNSQRHLQRREEQQEEKRGRILGTKAQAGQRVKNINARRRHITYTDSDEEDLTQ